MGLANLTVKMGCSHYKLTQEVERSAFPHREPGDEAMVQAVNSSSLRGGGGGGEEEEKEGEKRKGGKEKRGRRKEPRREI